MNSKEHHIIKECLEKYGKQSVLILMRRLKVTKKIAEKLIKQHNFHYQSHT